MKRALSSLDFADEAAPRAELGSPFGALPPPGVDEEEAVLEVRGLTVCYGDAVVLRDIYCHFRPRTVTAIMGPSGCGKSTLVKTLNRTIELTSGARVRLGSVWLHGRDLYASDEDPHAVRKRIGIIHQKPVVFPMSILENVLFGARFFRDTGGLRPRDYAELQLHRVGLLDEVKDRLHQPASRLSGGQQQRLCLARTLANGPEIVLMDEPCSALDPVATQRIEELVRELKRDYTIVLVTHNLNQARRVADEAILMVGGRIIEAGSRDRMFATPKTELGQKFLSGAIG